MYFKFLKIVNSPSNQLVELLKENRIGTPGLGMLYQHLEIQKKIDHIEDPFYVNLVKGNNIIGSCCFCGRLIMNSGNPINSFYIRYFSFKDTYRTKQATKKNNSGNSFLRNELISLLAGAGLGEGAKGKFFHYAYLDPRNLRSAVVCKEFGFETVRQFSTLIFNRLHPKENKRVIEISPSEVNEVKEMLSVFYKDYTMFSFENLFNSRKYYVIKDEGGKIVAGVQAEPDHWKIHEMPGFSGKIILTMFSFIPYLNKLINKNYRFLTLEGIYYAPGYESSLSILIENLLAKYKVNSAMIWVDSESSIYQSLQKLSLGIVHKLKKEVKANVICKFINFDKNEIKTFKNKPAYISGIDLT
jgi:hypothetical protein